MKNKGTKMLNLWITEIKMEILLKSKETKIVFKSFYFKNLNIHIRREVNKTDVNTIVVGFTCRVIENIAHR